MSAVRIIGIGNPDRGDDGAGPAVIAVLAVAPPVGALLSTARGDMVALLDSWTAADRVFLIDALAPESTPGRVLRLDAGVTPVAAEFAAFASTHAFNLAETIELARALGRLPAMLVVYGIEVAGCDPGAPLSPAVAQAVPEVAALLQKECDQCTKPR